MGEPLTALQDNAVDPIDDTSTRHRRRAATQRCWGSSDQTKLSLSELALPAGVSGPTLYRWFASKQELLDAFGCYEREMFDSGISSATVGLRGAEKLDAALRFIVKCQRSYSGVRPIDVEPEVVIAQRSRIMPLMRARLMKLLPGPNAGRCDDGGGFLAQLRHPVCLEHVPTTVAG